MAYNISRFLTAQEGYYGYETALAEIKQGRKCTHWIWYIFPQIDGLGFSPMAKAYAIASLDEAKEYMANETLRSRLYEITKALLENDDTAKNILGVIDAKKVKSSMTLFDAVVPNDVFGEVIEKFYNGERCKFTLARI